MSGSAQIFPLGAQPSTKNGAGGTITIQLLPLGDCLLGLFFFKPSDGAEICSHITASPKHSWIFFPYKKAEIFLLLKKK